MFRQINQMSEPGMLVQINEFFSMKREIIITALVINNLMKPTITVH